MMQRSLVTLAAVTLSLAAATPALAQSAEILTPTPVIEPAGNRYILMVLDQGSRDLTKGRTKVNMLLDTKTGKTWILEFGVKQNSNENGYVWSEVPFNQAPK
jgi:hypothetical protein